MSLIKILIPLFSLAIGYYFQWQARRLRSKRHDVPNSYALGRMYKQIQRYEAISKIVYISSLIITCATYLY
jgi:hypothetical protein